MIFPRETVLLNHPDVGKEIIKSANARGKDTGRKLVLWSKDRVAILHNEVGLEKIEISELHNIIPSAFR